MSNDIHVTGIEGGSGLYWAGLSNTTASGFQATIDQYMKVLMTVKGSDPFDRTRGTAFAELPGSNMGGRMDLVKQIVAESVKDAETAIRNGQARAVVPKNARLRSAVLQYFTAIDATSFEAAILLENVAGERLATLLPHVSL